MLQRIQLCIVFGLNILTSICSGIKTQYLAELGNRTDQTWATYDIFAWVTAELFLLVVCGTVPTLHPVLRAVQSSLVFLTRKVKPRSPPSEGDPKQGDEVLTIGKIRMHLRQTSERTVDEDENEAQPTQWRVRTRVQK